MAIYRVKNWGEFQHYKDRNPSWIKLHKSLLDNYEYQCLPVASRALAPMLWLLASESKTGEIDGDFRKIGFRLRMTENEVREAIDPLVSGGFLECSGVASKTLAEAGRDASPEKETQVTTKTEKESPSDFDDWWSAYPKRVGKGQALKAYRSACKKTDPETLLTHARRYAAERDGEDKRFTKHPATWLNGQCWLDEPEEPHATGRSNRNPDEAERRRIIAETLDLAGGEESGGDDGSMAHGAGMVIQHAPGGEDAGESGNTGPGSDASTGEPQGSSRGDGQAAGIRGGLGKAVRCEGGGDGLGGGVGRLAAGFADGSGNENDSEPQIQHAPCAGGNSGARCGETGAAEAGAAHRPDGIDYFAIPEFMRVRA